MLLLGCYTDGISRAMELTQLGWDCKLSPGIQIASFDTRFAGCPLPIHGSSPLSLGLAGVVPGWSVWKALGRRGTKVPSQYVSLMFPPVSILVWLFKAVWIFDRPFSGSVDRPFSGSETLVERDKVITSFKLAQVIPNSFQGLEYPENPYLLGVAGKAPS